MDIIRQEVTLPTGLHACMWISLDVIVVRVNGSTCVAHRRWMSNEQLTDLSAVLAEAAGKEG